jgi:serine/threonine protein kinase
VSSDGKWKLAGFGSNQLLTSEDIHIIEEKLYDYSCSAPELALNKQYNKRTDSFSIGVIIIQLLEFIHKEYKPFQLVDQS